MNLEALLLGLEPVTALAVGLGAVILAPVVSAVGSAAGVDSNKLGEAVSESARELTKNSLVWGIEALENAQATYAQAEESFRDLVADAMTEHKIKKTEEKKEPRDVEILSE
jgi:hypothetical protein